MILNKIIERNWHEWDNYCITRFASSLLPREFRVLRCSEQHACMHGQPHAIRNETLLISCRRGSTKPKFTERCCSTIYYKMSSETHVNLTCCT
jgi:hypothetical protein